MAKYLLYLLLPLSLLKISDSYAQSYIQNYTANYTSSCRWAISCSSTSKGGDGGCYIKQICEPIAVPVVTCTSSFNEKTESCPPNYSGSKKYTQEVSMCSDGTTKTNGWKLYSDTCTADPPSCQISSQIQTLNCDGGYTGSIVQTRVSSCPNPYAPPIWLPWTTTSNSCVKSVTNPTNPTSPISPISPSSPTALPPPPPPAPSQPPPAPPPPTASDAPPSPAPNQTQPAPTSNQTSTALPPSGGQASSSAPAGGTQASSSAPPPKGKMNVAGLGTAVSLDLIVKPSLVQASIFPVIDFGQSIPKEILMNDQTMMGLLTITPLYQTPFKEELDLTQ